MQPPSKLFTSSSIRPLISGCRKQKQVSIVSVCHAIKEGQTFSGVKKSLRINNLCGYYKFIVQCLLNIQLLAPKIDAKPNIITHSVPTIKEKDTIPPDDIDKNTATLPKYTETQPTELSLDTKLFSTMTVTPQPTLQSNMVTINDFIIVLIILTMRPHKLNKSSFMSLHSGIWSILTQWSKTENAQPSTYYD
jgi:hypothetical protein